jgi:eukaryotic-like serine/threonine-protein kinase
MDYCFQCGVITAPDDLFCGNCGISLLVPPSGAKSKESPSLPTLEPHQDTSGNKLKQEDQVVSASMMSSSTGGQQAEPNKAAEPASVVSSIEPPINTESQKSNSLPVSKAVSSTDIQQVQNGSHTGAKDVNQPKTGDSPKEISLEPQKRESAPSLDATITGPPIANMADAVSAERHKPAIQSATVGSSGKRQSAPKLLEAGTILNGRYEIVRRIGGGGMGAVYLAKDRNLGEALRAVKEMIQSPMDDSQHEKAVGDFKRESLLLTSLEHPSIPTIYDYFYDEHAERFYLVMKYISGGDLLARLRTTPEGKIDEKTVTEWGIQIADVLDYLHNRRPPIIYRDLKPANLMIDGNSGRIMLIDFGIARWVAPQEKGVTAVGTMGYAPPELFSGKVEPRSDIYSLGATLFHLLTGVDPQDNPLLIFDFNKNPRPTQLHPNLSKGIEYIIMRSVECTPEDRFVSAAEMRESLSQHLNSLISGDLKVSSSSTKGDATVGMEVVFCGFCGGRITSSDVFCAYCGSRQPQVNSSAALHRKPRTTAKLVVAGTTKLDASFALEKESQLVGRTDPHSNIFPEIDLSKYDPHTKVSRRHARIWREGDNYLVEDLGSVNGTVVNDAVRLAPRQPRVLESGDKLRLGETTLHFLIS